MTFKRFLLIKILKLCIWDEIVFFLIFILIFDKHFYDFEGDILTKISNFLLSLTTSSVSLSLTLQSMKLFSNSPSG